MKSFLAVMLLATLATTAAMADTLEYDLEVDGMVCAYCAYNVSKQLASLDGVAPESVDVDLKHGRVTLRSEKELQRSQMADLLLEAGFELKNVTATAASTPPPRQQSQREVLVSVSMNSERVSDGEFDMILDALGAVAAKQSGRISIVGPGELESAILKPVLAGRRTVIKVDYEHQNRSDQTVAVSIQILVGGVTEEKTIRQRRPGPEPQARQQ